MSFSAWFLVGLVIGGAVSFCCVCCYIIAQRNRFQSAVVTLNSKGFTAHRYQAIHNDEAMKKAMDFIAKRGYIVADTTQTPVGTVTAHHEAVPNYKLRFDRVS